jgi:hypothetical protein
MEATMKSQVNALLHVLRGLIKDAQAAYPAMGDDLEKDYERIALLCEDRDLEVFTSDLPSLESCLLRGLDSGRLSLEGPLSKRKSPKIQVPRLFSGLWLRIFDAQACLLTEVDVTAVAFLRQFLVLGKKLLVECPPDRIKATVEAYHDIERELRSPTLEWERDELYAGGTYRRWDSNPTERICSFDSYLNGSDHLHSAIPTCPSSNEEQLGYETVCSPAFTAQLDRLHLRQAKDNSPEMARIQLPLFRDRKIAERNEVDDSLLEEQRLLSRIQQVADLVTGSFGSLDPISFSRDLETSGRGIGFKHGPGAVAERLKNWEKSQFPNWTAKLDQVFPYEQCGKTAGSDDRHPINHEVASRLICVPKTIKSPRLIAAEPTSHQWCQQLVLQFLFDQCRRHFGEDFIDFKDQSKSGRMVLQASLDRDLATVDLSDASDRLTCWTVERMFRKNPSLLLALHAARTRYLRDEVSEDMSFLKLKKFASQGTATTFPVMSLVMLFIAIGSCIRDDESVSWGLIRKYRTQVRVFGDDIILPRHGYERLLKAMDLLQLKINTAKSYVNGHFRESCGVDGYKGYDVTPLKPKNIVADSPASCQAVVDNSNNLYKKGYWNASTACLDLLPVRLRRRIRVVGPHDVGFSGITSYSGGDESHLIRRWNSRFHRYEVRVWTTSVSTQEHPRVGFPALLDFFASKHNHEHARIVSEFAEVRKTRSGLRWEPSNHHSRITARLEKAQQ